MILKVNNIDLSSLVAGLQVSYETLVSDDSGRNAAGDTVIDIVNRKIKLSVSLRHTTNIEMKTFLDAIQPYVVTVTFLNPQTKTEKTIQAYCGTAQPEYYTVSDKTIFKPLSINFIEL